jgi:hypothetical protein
MEKFYLFERANKTKDGGFSFFIECSLLDATNKVTFVIVKRDSEDRRIDYARFFLEYRKLRAVLAIMERRLTTQGKKAAYKEKFYGGTGGNRKLDIELKDSTIYINMEDKLIQKEFKGADKFTGKQVYFLNKALDFQEFFDIKNTLNNWELVHIGALVNDTAKTDTKE